MTPEAAGIRSAFQPSKERIPRVVPHDMNLLLFIVDVSSEEVGRVFERTYVEHRLS